MNRYDWRAFIGPRYEPADDAARFEWWTPGNLEDTVELDATLTDGAATITLAYVPFDSRGGVWVGPNGSGEAWEYVAYAGATFTQLTGCTREAAAGREHNGVHTAGATVRQWWPAESAGGTLRLSESIDESVITWQAEISGWRAVQPALRENHAIVIQTSTNGGAWATALVGFIRDVRISDDGRKLAEWSFSIVSVATLLQSHRAPGLRIGDFNIAPAAQVRTSTVLADVRRESKSGDFAEANPQISGDSMVDETPGTLWIAEKVMGPAETAANAPSGYNSFASKIRIHRWPGETDKSRYIEWFMPAGSYQDAYICGANHGSGDNITPIQFNDITATAGERIILCEEEETFRRLHPLAADADLREIGSGFFDALHLDADCIAIYDNNFNGWSQTVAWGSILKRPHWDSDTEDDSTGPNMTGSTPCVAPAAGQTIRFYYTAGASETADHFYTDYLEYAGYLSGAGDPAWAMLTLPEIGLQLDGDITAGAPGAGARLYIADLSGAGSTIGLADSGTVQIGTEQITYNGRTVDSVNVLVRGANGTTAAAHVDGDLVQTLDGATATTAPLVTRIEWQRAQTPAPSHFVVRTSSAPSALAPGESGYWDDWTVVADVSSHSALDYSLTLGAPARVRHVLIEITRMGANPARPRLNEIRVILSATAYDGAVAMDADTVEDVAQELLAGASYNGPSVTVATSGQIIDGITTDNQASAWEVLASLARYANALVDVRRDGALAVGMNNLIAGTLTPATTLTAVQAAAVEMVQSGYAGAAQVRLPWRTPDGATVDEVRYPATPATAGEIVELDQSLFPDSTTATYAAIRAYIMRRYPVLWLIECAEEQPTLRPGAVVRVQWQLDSTMQQADRTVIIAAADHELSDGKWATVLQCKQVDRAAPG